MKTYYRVLLDFIGISIPKLVAFTGNVVTKLTNNLHFPNPAVALSDVDQAKQDLIDAYDAAQGGGVAETTAMHLAEGELLSKLKVLASDINTKSAGSKLKIETSGFNHEKDPEPRKEIVFAASSTKVAGEIEIIHQSVAGAVSYVWLSCQKEEVPPFEEFKFCTATSKRKATLDGMKSRTRYWFTCFVVMRNESESFYADPIFEYPK